MSFWNLYSGRIREWETGLAGFDRGFIQQKDGNIVAYGIDASTLAALQGLAIVLEHQRLLAYGADENVEQIFGKHDEIILACFSVHAEIPAQISELRSILQFTGCTGSSFYPDAAPNLNGLGVRLIGRAHV